jgi:CBS domain containing-hemolysin-like protein
MLFDQFVVLFVLLVLSGFFSSAETALFSISKAQKKKAGPIR